MRGSIVIALFFAAGVAAGHWGLLPRQIDAGGLCFPVLCLLIFFVGTGIGSDTGLVKAFRRLSPGLALLPAVSMLGTLAASAAVGLLSGRHSVSEWMAVGSGFGYYSLSSVIISECKGAELGTVALLSNVVREMTTLLFAPLLARVFGTLAPIAAAGATAMDTSLPVITRTCGQQYAPVAIYSGVVTDFCVPFLVTLFCSM